MKNKCPENVIENVRMYLENVRKMYDLGQKLMMSGMLPYPEIVDKSRFGTCSGYSDLSGNLSTIFLTSFFIGQEASTQCYIPYIVYY